MERFWALHPHLDVIDRGGPGARVVVDVNASNRRIARDTEESRLRLGARGARELEQADRLALAVVDANVPASPKKEPGQLEADAPGLRIGKTRSKLAWIPLMKVSLPTLLLVAPKKP